MNIIFYMFYFCLSLKFLYVSHLLEKCKNGFVLISQLKKRGWSFPRRVLNAGFQGIC